MGGKAERSPGKEGEEKQGPGERWTRKEGENTYVLE